MFHRWCLVCLVLLFSAGDLNAQITFQKHQELSFGTVFVRYVFFATETEHSSVSFSLFPSGGSFEWDHNTDPTWAPSAYIEARLNDGEWHYFASFSGAALVFDTIEFDETFDVYGSSSSGGERIWQFRYYLQIPDGSWMLLGENDWQFFEGEEELYSNPVQGTAKNYLNVSRTLRLLAGGSTVQGTQIIAPNSEATFSFTLTGAEGTTGQLVGLESSFIVEDSDPLVVNTLGDVFTRHGRFGEEKREVDLNLVVLSWEETDAPVTVSFDGNAIGTVTAAARNPSDGIYPSLRTYSFKLLVSPSSIVTFDVPSPLVYTSGGTRGDKSWTYKVEVGTPPEGSTSTTSTPTDSGTVTNVSTGGGQTTIQTGTVSPSTGSAVDVGSGIGDNGSGSTGGETPTSRPSAPEGTGDDLSTDILNELKAIRKASETTAEHQKAGMDAHKKSVAVGELISQGEAAAGDVEDAFTALPTFPSVTGNSSAPNLTIALPAQFSGKTFDLNPFTESRFGGVASMFRTLMAWTLILVFGVWIFGEMGKWSRGFSQLKQAQGNTIAGSGGQVTALIAAGAITGVIITGIVALASWSFGELTVPAVLATAFSNPLTAIPAAVYWMIDQIWPVATSVTVLIARLGFNLYAPPLFAGVATVIRFIVP